MHVIENRVLESSISTGTGAFALTAVVGYRRFSSRRAVGDTCEYLIEAVDAVGRSTGDYEYGVGTYGVADTISRTLVIGSSNGDALVDFPAGPKRVVLPMLAPVTDDMRFRWQEAIGLYMAGDIVFTAASTPPQGTVKCNKAALSRATYARLFSRIGVLWGAGDGVTTFNVPELRGEFLRGWDDGRGIDSGRVLGSLQDSGIESHAHAMSPTVTLPGTGSSYGVTYNSAGSGAPLGGVQTGDVLYPPGPSETRPRNIALMACIRY